MYEEAADLGHPLAMYELAISRGLVRQIGEAASANRDGLAHDWAPVQQALDQNGHLLFGALQRGALDAYFLVDSLEKSGLTLEGNKLALATLPGGYDIENALNHMLRTVYMNNNNFGASFGLPMGQIISCDRDWCVLAGSTYFRFSYPDTYSCRGGGGRATCDITFRFVQRLDVGSLNNLMTDAANSMMSSINRARPINATLELVRDGRTWLPTGPMTIK